jgi:RNA polymerase sigma-70 factor (ECF subfamily)
LSTPGVRKDVESDGRDEPAADDDFELVRRCQSGDLPAFEGLVERYQDRVFNLVFRLSGHHQDAQDITQDVFLRALEHIGKFRQQAKFYTWLFRIAVNVAISRRRRGSRVRFVSLDGAGGDDDESGGELRAGQLPNPAAETPDAAADRNEQREQVAAAIAGLDDEFRSVLVLKDIEGFDYQQIAEVLELPLGTVKSRLHRARCELRDKLQPMLYAEP